MGDNGDSKAWRGADRHQQPKRPPSRKAGNFRRSVGCVVTGLGIASALTAVVAQTRGWV